MSNTLHHAMAISFVLLSSFACREPLPCPDCEEADVADDPDEAEPLPDLPCGGADLMTDNDNCGSCGNECPVWFEGTAWEAGTCIDGQCGPTWTQCGNYSDQSCAEVCGGFGRTCVAQGCSGMTAALYWVGLEGYCQTGSPPHLTMMGSCDEPIPYESDIEGNIHAMCCCELP